MRRQSQTGSSGFRFALRKYYSQIFSYVLIRTASVDTAQDVTSNVFFKALKNIGAFRWKEVPFSAWLYRIANNEIANHYRTNGHGMVLVQKIQDTFCEEIHIPEAELEAAETKLVEHQRFLAIQRVITTLPVKYQEVIMLRFFENKQLSEIAAIIGKPEGTVKTLLYRGLTRLRVTAGENPDLNPCMVTVEEAEYASKRNL
jgi:RNA polymerase sigma-70 factor (ECF subfamily)